MLAVQEVVVHQVDEKLAATRVGPGVGHADGATIVSILARKIVLDGIAARRGLCPWDRRLESHRTVLI